MNLRTLHKIGYGMYVVGAKAGERLNGQIANAVIQVCAEPPVIAVCINKENLTNEFIREGKVFAVSILSEETPMKFIGQFGFKSGREVDKFKDVNYKVGVTGAPIMLENSVGYIEAELLESTEMGTHTVFFGQVVAAEVLNDNPPMTYAYYHQVKRGKSPKTAPTYIKEENGKGVRKVEKYRCTVCGYVYDPEKGDPDSGIEPGTAFEDIPDDWVCPICGAGKEDFEPI